jgi:8-amino-7-oxononanoate synthase
MLSPATLARPSRSSDHVPRLADFEDADSDDLFEKCRRLHRFADGLRRQGLYQVQYRVVLDGPLDHRIRVRHPFEHRTVEMICFDSNSYLGLHLHPRVVAAVHRTLDVAGYGTPSAQMLGGTSRWLLELEETLAAFHGREAALVFPSGYAANVGILTGLLRPGDVVVRDQYSHASLHDGARFSGGRARGVYRHLDLADLERVLQRESLGARGKLIATDGVFSMHGRVAPLPELLAIGARYGARLLIDEAHSVGVFGATGRGLEEHFGVPGAIDLLMGTFSKAPGSVGGYLCGSADVIEYLRVFARSAMFTASLPAATCAGVSEAFRVMVAEPEHRERLWRNTRRLWEGFQSARLPVAPFESPILPVFMGHDALLWAVSRDLFLAGVKCGNVSFPAVPVSEGVLRFSVSARHTDEDVERTVDVLTEIGRRYGLLGATHEEIRTIGRRLAHAAREDALPTCDSTVGQWVGGRS